MVVKACIFDRLACFFFNKKLVSNVRITNLNLLSMTINFETIEKEAIETLRFPHNEVLEDEAAINQRENELERALSLGNLEHSKIKIFFEDDLSQKVVETTVWALTDESVVLKKGVGIPINRILKIA